MQADADRLRLPIVEDVELGELRERNPVAARIEAQFDARADHLLSRNAVSFVHKRAHEVGAAGRDDVSLEAVRPQIGEQLDLRLIDALFEQSADLGMLRRREPSTRDLDELLVGYARMGGEG